MTEQEFGQAVARTGGRAYIVGGWVRDYLMGRNPHDKDYVITGFNQQQFQQAFPNSWLVGNAFPVFMAKIDNELVDKMKLMIGGFGPARAKKWHRLSWLCS